MTTLLAGCASEQLAAPEAAVTPVSMPRSADEMVGRWILSAPNAPSCGMDFAAKPASLEGVVEPEGGCPRRFFTSRRWQLADGQLLISDRDNAPLAQLKFVGGSFQGQSSDGEPITLTRSPL